MEITLFITVFACLGMSLLLMPRSSGGITVKARPGRGPERMVPTRLLFSSTPAPVARC